MRRVVMPSARTCVAIAHDAMMAAVSFVLALYLRLGDEQFYLTKPYLDTGALTFTVIAITVFTGMRLYRGLWRYASLPDMVALVKAASVAIAMFYGFVLFTATRLEGVPRSVPFIQWLLLLALLGAPRFLYRAVKDRTLRFDFRHDASKQIPLLLVGATDSAELFIRNCQRDAASPWRVAGLLDDAPEKKNLFIHGVRIYGNIEALRPTVGWLDRKGLKPQRVIVCDDNIDAKKVGGLLEETEKLGITLGRLPGMDEFRQGAVDKPDIRPIVIEDLLGRAQNVHDREAMRALIAGKRVAITGAGGSIGAELCRQAAALEPTELLLIEQGEHALYQIDLELQEIAPSVKRQAALADVRRAAQIDELFAQFRPQLVFHAAAIKHVPLSESNAVTAIETNVLGTCNVAEAAKAHGVGIMVLISTDKAVNPTNVMGASKRLAEMCCYSLNTGSTRVVTVRFGNVLGSTGSVVPLFQRQLARGGPITVTHPDMVRYFMTIREAVELVIQAASLGARMKGQKDAVFVLDMGKPVRITDLATQMIRLAGLKPGRDIEIAYTGLRPGEKLFEELFYDAEKVQHTEYPGILIANVHPAEPEGLKKSLEMLADCCKQRNAPEAVRLLKGLVPEFQTPQKVAA